MHSIATINFVLVLLFERFTCIPFLFIPDLLHDQNSGKPFSPQARRFAKK